MKRLWRVWGGFGAAAALACGGSTDPDLPLESLAAAAVEGNALPATAVSWADYHLELLADTVRFLPGRRWERVHVERFTGFVGTPEVRRLESDGTVEWFQGRIYLNPTCPPDADCIPGEELEPVAGGYELSWQVAPETWVTVRFTVLDAS